MILNRIFCVLMVLVGLIEPAFGDAHRIYSQYSGAWGGAVRSTLRLCGAHSLTAANACIGETSDCQNRTVTSRNSLGNTVLLLVAKQFNDHGAVFCPMQPEAHIYRNLTYSAVRTEYTWLTNDDCEWLCKSGWTGDSCQFQTSQVTECDNTLVNKDRYKDIKHKSSGTNHEFQFAMFAEESWWYGCDNSPSSQEHSLILAIVKWTPSGHGAFAQQVVVRAAEDVKNKNSATRQQWVNVYPATGAPPILVCKNGYKPNPAQSDCIAIKDHLCKVKDMCSDYKSGFNENAHRLVMKNGCYQYRCAADGFAFESKTNHTCTACPMDDLHGVNPDDGTCVTCDTGHYFSANAKNSGYCGKMLALTHDELRYGHNQTQNSNPQLMNQCWHLRNPSDMRQCVLNGGNSGSNAGNGE